MVDNIIETKQLTKKFGKESVLKEIDIHVRRENVYGLGCFTKNELENKMHNVLFAENIKKKY